MKHVSNADKANEIANAFYIGEVSEENERIIREMLNKAALEAMQWKDEQEIQFLQSLMFQASTQQALNTIINNRIKLLKGE